MKSSIILAGLVIATASGCSTPRYPILTVPAVSMTRASTDEVSSAKAAGKVEAEFCTGDDPISSKDQNVGLIDEVIMKAQKQSGAEYLTDVVISTSGKCVMIEATAMK